MKWKDGSQDVLANLGDDGAFVDDGYADDNDLEVGSTVEVTFPDGTTETYTVDGIFDPPTGGSPFGSMTISTEAWDAKVENPRNLYTFIAMEGDVDRREHGRPRRSARGLPERQGTDAPGVHRQPDLRPQLRS